MKNIFLGVVKRLVPAKLAMALVFLGSAVGSATPQVALVVLGSAAGLAIPQQAEGAPRCRYNDSNKIYRCKFTNEKWYKGNVGYLLRQGPNMTRYWFEDGVVYRQKMRDYSKGPRLRGGWPGVYNYIEMRFTTYSDKAKTAQMIRQQDAKRASAGLVAGLITGLAVGAAAWWRGNDLFFQSGYFVLGNSVIQIPANYWRWVVNDDNTYNKDKGLCYAKSSELVRKRYIKANGQVQWNSPQTNVFSQGSGWYANEFRPHCV